MTRYEAASAVTVPTSARRTGGDPASHLNGVRRVSDSRDVIQFPSLRAIGAESLERYGLDYEILEAWSYWLGRRDWSHFVSLTTEYPATVERLKFEFHCYLRRIARLTQRPLAWFYAIESVVHGDRPHLHALLAFTDVLRTQQLERAWRLGYTRVAVYDSARGAAYYVTKDILASSADFDISTRRAPLHREALSPKHVDEIDTRFR